MTDHKKWTEVVAGVLYNDAGQFLLSSRPEGKAYAGYWEFAGGKVEEGETPFSALQREFKEELGIDVLSATPWLTKRHCYEHANVCLQFYKIHDWAGQLQSLENQDYCWQDSGALTVEPMLPANAPILKGLALPTDLEGDLEKGFVGHNSLGDWAVEPALDLAHLPKNSVLRCTQLRLLQERPEGLDWVIAEVVTHDDLAQAQALGLDAVVLPLMSQATIEDAQNWLLAGVSIPVIGLCSPEVNATSLMVLGLHALIIKEAS